MPRLFVALDVPDTVRTALSEVQSGLDDARWTRPEQMHVTLRFLGDTDPDRLPALRDALGGVSASPLSLHLDGMTAFPSRRRPRVIVARVSRTDALLDLHAQVDDAVQSVGFDAEDRTYRPHVTVARLHDADARTVHEYLKQHAPDTPFDARAFHLYESNRQPDGTVYDKRASFPLK